MPAHDVGPDEWECRVFVAVAEHRTYSAAADSLSAQTGRSYTARSVGKVIKKIETWFNEPVFEERLRRRYTTPRGDDFLYSARIIVNEYQLLRDPAPASGHPTLACLAHHVHFVSRAEAALLAKSPERVEINLQFLEQRHSADRIFRDAIRSLRHDVFQLIIGPPVVGEKTLVSKDLYEARLEALVPRSNAANNIPLADLARQRLFLPTDERWRRTLEEEIAALGVPEPRKDHRIPMDLSTAILRISNAAHLGRDIPVVVAPSDAALAFTSRGEFGGTLATVFRWIPVTLKDANGTSSDVAAPRNGKSHYLKQKVAVTVKRTESAALFPIVEALKKAVAELRRDDS
jgi:DNA-binding transcriptional LysR family regulator